MRARILIGLSLRGGMRDRLALTMCNPRDLANSVVNLVVYARLDGIAVDDPSSFGVVRGLDDTPWNASRYNNIFRPSFER